MIPLPIPESKMPVPNGVIAATGRTRPPLTEEDLHHITGDSAVVVSRAQRGPVLSIDSSVDDPMDLTQTGWGVLFASDADPAIKDALKPLLDWRSSQVKDDQLFRVFEGAAGVRPSQAPASWAANKGVSLVAPVDPLKGVPYYLLIVGSPSRIPFEFQAQFDLQWAVGRLHFDDVAGYASYAQKVVEYEQGKAAGRARRTAVWMTRNPGDMATALLAGSVGPDFMGQLPPRKIPLGQKQGFDLSTFIGDDATKACLTDLLRGGGNTGLPSILFTGSHGAEFDLADPARQRRLQGSLVTQEWTGKPLTQDQFFCADDVPADAQIHGLIVFMFACFGGGCPAFDSYVFAPNGSQIKLAPEPMIAALPQQLLSRGALAVIAHVDRAFAYGFADVMDTPQVELFRTPLELLMKGKRAGWAMDPINSQWSSLAAQLGLALGGNIPGNPQPQSSTIANLYIARDDARNYILLGDPAVRLSSQGSASAVDKT